VSFAFLSNGRRKKNHFSFNDNKTVFDHNHTLDHKGISKEAKHEVLQYMAKQELEHAYTPGQIYEKAEAYLQGKGILEENKFKYSVCAAMHYSMRNQIYGPPHQDAASLLDLADLIKINFPQSLCEISTVKVEEGKEKLVNFVASTKNMKNLYKKFNDVILIDNTYKTNRFRMPLLVLAGISEEAKTFVLGFAALKSEEECNVNWALSKILEFLEVKLKIICTDQCPTLKKVLTNIVPQSTHLWCGWHINQNIAKHLAPISNKFYSCCKNY